MTVKDYIDYSSGHFIRWRKHEGNTLQCLKNRFNLNIFSMGGVVLFDKLSMVIQKRLAFVNFETLSNHSQ